MTDKPLVVDQEFLPAKNQAPAKQLDGELLPRRPAGLIRADGVIFPYTEELAALPSMKPLDKLPPVSEMLEAGRLNAQLRIRLREERRARRRSRMVEPDWQATKEQDKQLAQVVDAVQELPARKFGVPVRKWVLGVLSFVFRSKGS